MTRELRNKNILITGGAGFIGSHLSDALFNIPVGNLIVDWEKSVIPETEHKLTPPPKGE